MTTTLSIPVYPGTKSSFSSAEMEKLALEDFREIYVVGIHEPYDLSWWWQEIRIRSIVHYEARHLVRLGYLKRTCVKKSKNGTTHLDFEITPAGQAYLNFYKL
jgi:hypothetical protein